MRKVLPLISAEFLDSRVNLAACARVGSLSKCVHLVLWQSDVPPLVVFIVLPFPKVQAFEVH